jgi:hypothetical protein
VLPKRVRILWDWEDLQDGDSGWPAAQPIRQNPGSEGLIRFRHRINQAIPITGPVCYLRGHTRSIARCPRRQIAAGIPSRRFRPGLTFSTSAEAQQTAYDRGTALADDSFRLPILQPECAGKEDTLECVLETSSISSARDYEALSYVWNDPYAPVLLRKHYSQSTTGSESACHMFCNGAKVEVTANLYTALRRLRLKSRLRVLWIDALCINQRDTKEKARQIPQMGSIYRQARNVVIWLGEEDRWTGRSRDAIRRWAQRYRTTGSATQPEILQKLKELRTFTEEQDYFEAFIRRAWFTRAWTFQEVCLPREATLHCGKYTIPWEDFQDACACVVKAGQEQLVFKEHRNVQVLCEYRSLYQNISPSDQDRDPRLQLSSLVHRLSHHQATDPRDRLHALLGIANPATRYPDAYAVDYEESTRDVFIRFARAMIHEDRDLRVLSCIRKPHEGKVVEYWMRGYLRNRPKKRLAMINLQEQIRSEDDKRLTVEGAKLRYMLRQFTRFSMITGYAKEHRKAKRTRDIIMSYIKHRFSDDFVGTWKMFQQQMADPEIASEAVQSLVRDIELTVLPGWLE